MSPARYSDVEARLMEALQEAKADYEATKTGFDFARSHLKDLGPDYHDGRAALHKPIVAHNLAFAKYKRAVEDFDRFILDGKVL
jgi:hypothetical protein